MRKDGFADEELKWQMRGKTRMPSPPSSPPPPSPTLTSFLINRDSNILQSYERLSVY